MGLKASYDLVKTVTFFVLSIGIGVWEEFAM
jgi:hypothetical protein